MSKKQDSALTVKTFTEGLDRFYETRIAPEFADIRKEFGGLREEFGSMKKDFGGMRIDVFNLSEDVKGIKEILAIHTGQIRNLYNHVDGLYKRFDTLETEYHVIKHSIEETA